MKKNTLLFLILVLLGTACTQETIYTPKPRTYPRVDLPTKAYQSFDKSFCNFTFEYPTYATIEQDTVYFDTKIDNPCWFDIVVPSLNSRIHFSYFEIKNKERLEELVADAFDLAQKHNVKADYIDEIPVRKENLSGFVFDIEGATASQMQFYLTDSTQHYIRGSMYFESESRADSIAPISDFIKKDIMKMIETFEWE